MQAGRNAIIEFCNVAMEKLQTRVYRTKALYMDNHFKQRLEKQNDKETLYYRYIFCIAHIKKKWEEVHIYLIPHFHQ